MSDRSKITVIVKNANDEELNKTARKLNRAIANNDNVNAGRSKQQLKADGDWKGSAHKENRQASRALNRAANNFKTALNNWNEALLDIRQLQATQPALYDKLNTLPVDVYIGRSDASVVSKNGGACNEFHINGRGEVVTYTSLTEGGERSGITIWSNRTSLNKLYHEGGHIASYYGGVPALGLPGVTYGPGDGVPHNLVDLRNKYSYLLTGNDDEFRNAAGARVPNETVQVALAAERLHPIVNFNRN